MKSNRSSRYSAYRFPSEIIRYAIWTYHRFCLSFRDVEDLLAERGILVSYETIRLWCQRFGADYVRKLKRRQGRLRDRWHLDEVFLPINGQLQYLWRAIDQDGDVIDILVQPRRDRRAAERFFRRLVRGQGREPLRNHHRQTEKLLGRDPSQLLQRGSHDRALRQQSVKISKCAEELRRRIR
jgi:putative transposase